MKSFVLSKMWYLAGTYRVLAIAVAGMLTFEPMGVRAETAHETITLEDTVLDIQDISSKRKRLHRDRSKKKHADQKPCFQAFCNQATHSPATNVIITVPAGVDCPQGTDSNQNAVLAKFKAMHPECSGSYKQDENAKDSEIHEMQTSSRKYVQRAAHRASGGKTKTKLR